MWKSYYCLIYLSILVFEILIYNCMFDGCRRRPSLDHNRHCLCSLSPHPQNVSFPLPHLYSFLRIFLGFPLFFELWEPIQLFYFSSWYFPPFWRLRSILVLFTIHIWKHFLPIRLRISLLVIGSFQVTTQHFLQYFISTAVIRSLFFFFINIQMSLPLIVLGMFLFVSIC